MSNEKTFEVEVEVSFVVRFEVEAENREQAKTKGEEELDALLFPLVLDEENDLKTDYYVTEIFYEEDEEENNEDDE